MKAGIKVCLLLIILFGGSALCAILFFERNERKLQASNQTFIEQSFIAALSAGDFVDLLASSPEQVQSRTGLIDLSSLLSSRMAIGPLTSIESENHNFKERSISQWNSPAQSTHQLQTIHQDGSASIDLVLEYREKRWTIIYFDFVTSLLIDTPA